VIQAAIMEIESGSMVGWMLLLVLVVGEGDEKW
jgi:hypothetical protein